MTINRQKTETAPPNPLPWDLRSSNFSADPDKFWKFALLRALRQASPEYVIDERCRGIIAAVYDWAWAKAGRGMGDTLLDPAKGLFLFGPIGTGKSTVLKALRIYEGWMNRYAFAFSNNRLGYQFTSAAEISLRYAESGIDGIARYTERELMTDLAIDELGREPADAKHFGTNLNVVQTVLQLRYECRHQFYTHITTNLAPDSIAAKYGVYIADRIKEMFNLIPVEGASRRR